MNRLELSSALRRPPRLLGLALMCLVAIMASLPLSGGRQQGREDLSSNLERAAAAGKGAVAPISDIVLITIDALRADHLGVYGHARRTTPNLDALAYRSLRFERAYTSTPHTSLAIGSLLTGRALHAAIRLSPESIYPTLPELLRDSGFRSAAIYPPAVFFTESARLKRYAESRFGFEHTEIDYFDAMTVAKRAIDFLESKPRERTFLWLHFFEPHEPYETHVSHAYGPTDRDRYDSEIAYTDFAIGHLLDYLTRQRKDAAIVVTADHGEAFDEHGDRYHGTSLYDEQIRVPLLLKLPVHPPGVVHMEVSTLDLAPTLLSLVGAALPPALQGHALISPADGSVRLGRRPVFAELGPLRMVAAANHKLLCNVTWGGCKLYDLSIDPGESLDEVPGAAEMPGLRSELQRVLDEEAQEFAARTQPRDPRWTLIGRGLLGDRTVAPELAKLLEPNVPLRLRRQAARELANLHVPFQTAAALRKAVRDPDLETAGFATVAGLTLELREARAAAQRMLARSTTPAELRTALALVLGEQGNAAATSHLLAALPACTEASQCQRIVRTLGRLRSPQAVPALLTALPRLEVRLEVVDALGEIAAPDALQPLIDCLLGDAYVPVRIAAARALGRLQHPAARTALLQAAARDSELGVVSEARQAAELLRAER